ncbi:hypothetical protein SPDO_00200 [Sphingomonas dokdonensis]|uniref:Insertion element IS402-like domain-containing protein n=1 Tax=Sphingomonas dokdonensis TaxID=344880 RepID=A0A245ZTT6_9SPHN|nr:hypothetical protein SPDO_00200 [Sphingomonas dokdonensis]
MSDLFPLTDEEVERRRPFFPRSHGKPRVDDRRVLSGIVFVNRSGLRWRDAPSAYDPQKTLYNRWKHRGERGVFARMMEGLASANAEAKTLLIDATYLMAHRTASSLRVKRGISDAQSTAPKVARTRSSMPSSMRKASNLASRDADPATSRSSTTSAATGAAVASRSCSGDRQPAAASPLGTTAAPASPSPPSPSLPPSSWL